MKNARVLRPLSWLAGGLCLAASGGLQAAAFDLPDVPRCTELLPGAIAVDSTPVTLGLRVVLDGVSQSDAAALVAAAATSYAPLGISLSVSYETASFGTNNGLELIAATKQYFGGQRPAGTHLVYVLTSKDLTDGAVVGDALAGQADCIGGSAYADSAFAVGEFDTTVGAKTMAHELGHLLGGHHHYANCAEALAKGGDNLCTLMFNDVGLASLPFSELNGVVVRGHAQLAAAAVPLADSDGTDNTDGAGSTEGADSTDNAATATASTPKSATGTGSGGLPLAASLVLLAAGLARRLRAAAAIR